MVKRNSNDILERKNKFLSKMNKVNNGHFELIGEFFNTKTPTVFKCGNCNNSFEIAPERLFYERKYCNRKECRYNEDTTRTKEKDLIIEKINRKFNNNFIYLDGFINTQTKCRFKCNNCKNENYYTTPTNLLDKRRKPSNIYCDNCKINIKLTKASLQNKLDKKYPSQFLVLTENIINNKEEIEFLSVNCNHHFKTTPTNILRRGKCRLCSKSSGELFLYEMLMDKNIEFECEKKFEGYNFRFDFYINRTNTLIELDGRMHRESGFNEDLKVIQKRDKIKDDFCRKNKIKLIRLPYDKNLFKEIFLPIEDLIKKDMI